MDSQILVYLFNKILFGNKRKQTADTLKNIEEFHRHMLNEQSRTPFRVDIVRVGIVKFYLHAFLEHRNLTYEYRNQSNGGQREAGEG